MKILKIFKIFEIDKKLHDAIIRQYSMKNKNIVKLKTFCKSIPNHIL